MFPLRDTQRIKVYPLFTHLIIALNIFVFLLEIINPNPDDFIFVYALIPANVDFSRLETLIPFVTSQFLHAGFIHILSNMWFLHIFGDNVEDRFGGLFYLGVYLLGGFVGGLIQYLFATGSTIPMLGASGAVAAVLGAYFVFFPDHRVETLVPLGFFVTTIRIPAQVMLFYWFITQIFSGVGSVAVAQVGGVAWWAHVGGFVTGWLIAKNFRKSGSAAEEGEVLDY